MSDRQRRRQSLWMYGLEAEEPSYEQRAAAAAELSQQLGVELTAPRIPAADALELRAPRITPPEHLAAFCTQDTWERAYHSYGSERSLFGVFGRYPNPPDVVAHPRTEGEVEAVLSWCSDRGYTAIPYGGGSSAVGGVTPPPDAGPVVTIALDELDQVLEIDETSRAARIQAGVFGPDLEDQLRPHGYTLRHFPQSFAGSTLGGWIATRSGGHYATNHTHIDEFVETVRMITPSGWWQARRLPASGPARTRTGWSSGQRGSSGSSPRPGCGSRPGRGSAARPASGSRRGRRATPRPGTSPRPSCGRPICGCSTPSWRRAAQAWTAPRPCSSWGLSRPSCPSAGRWSRRWASPGTAAGSSPRMSC